MTPEAALTPRLRKVGLALARTARAVSDARGAALLAGGYAFVDLEGGEAPTPDGVAMPAGASALPRASFTVLERPWPQEWARTLERCFPFDPFPVALCRLGEAEPPAVLALAGAPSPLPASLGSLATLAEALLAYEEEISLLERENASCSYELDLCQRGGLLLGQLADEETTLRSLVEEVQVCQQADLALGLLAEHESGALVVRSASPSLPGVERLLGQRTEVARSWVRQALELGAAALPGPALPEPLNHWLGPFQIASTCVVPLANDRSLEGVLVLGYRNLRPPGETQTRSLGLLARFAATALANARQYSSLWQEARRDTLTGLPSHRHFHELAARELERARGLRQPLSLLMVDLDNFRAVNETCGYDVGDRVLQEFAGFLREWSADGELIARYGGNQFGVLLPALGPAAALARAQHLRERLLAYRFLNLEEARYPERTLTASVVLASFPSDAQTVTQLVEAADRALLEAQRLGGDRVQAYAQVQSMAGESRWYTLLRSRLPGRSRDVYVSTIRTLLAALEAKDSYTSSHSHGVAYWSERIARCLGLPEDEVATVALGGLLHDIGKIGIPEAILRKKGPLTPAEYAQVKEHPALGEAILRNVGVTADVVEIVLRHQERYDGRGYPGGLAGEAIPLGARVVAVADAYHSITSRRPYRPARSPAEALAEIKRWAGIMFDPAAVTAFEAALLAEEAEEDGARGLGS